MPDETIEDLCTDELCDHSDEDHKLMEKHQLNDADYDTTYQLLLADNQLFGTLAMDELQAKVKADIEAGMHD
jgi:hypothetical protein